MLYKNGRPWDLPDKNRGILALILGLMITIPVTICLIQDFEKALLILLGIGLYYLVGGIFLLYRNGPGGYR